MKNATPAYVLKYLIFLLVFQSVTVSAQLRLWTDTTKLEKKILIELEGTYTNKKGTKTLGPSVRQIDWDRIKWKTVNCRHLGGRMFIFDRVSVLQNGGKIEITGTYKKSQSTVVVQLPMIVSIAFPDTFQKIRVNSEQSLQGTIFYSNGEKADLYTDPFASKMLGFPLIENVRFANGKVELPADKMIKPFATQVCIQGFSTICDTLKIRPDYAFTLQYLASGQEGGTGEKGSSGNDGCADCTNRGEDGEQGGQGGEGEAGGDAPDAEVWVKMTPEGLAEVKIIPSIVNEKYKEKISYIDLKNGGKIQVYLSGGKGGPGGKGGKGGAGLDEVGGKGPGIGGKGGTGGTGGIGGTGGRMTVFTDSACLPYVAQIICLNAGGEGGDGGEAGKNGRGGRKENAGIGGTLITGRAGDAGDVGSKGPWGLPGGSTIVVVVKKRIN